jgi:hypothetical protein
MGSAFFFAANKKNLLLLYDMALCTFKEWGKIRQRLKIETLMFFKIIILCYITNGNVYMADSGVFQILQETF